ncbi:MAG: FecR family protein [Nitrospira sp.]|nr:FecR family protein [Nitrospira sp.]
MPDSTPPDSPSPLLDEALAWLVRIHSGHVSDEERRACHAWRTQSSAHRVAYAEAEILWRDIGLLTNVDRARSPDTTMSMPHGAPRRTRRMIKWGMAACILLAAGWLSWGVVQERLAIASADYRTAVGQQRIVRLEDGSRLHLNTDTAVTVAFTPQQRTIRLLTGEANFTVAPENGRPFTVQSGNVNTRALGTSFLVRLQHRAVTVTVTEHAVQVSAADGRQVPAAVVRESEQISYSAESGLGPAHAVDSNVIAAWQRGKMLFESKPLAAVVDELNRYRAGRIMIVNPALRSLNVTGVFDISDPDAALRMIEQTLHIHDTTLTPYLVLLH